MTGQHHESILIVDFGSQVTQLIARRVREAGVYSEIAPFSQAEAAFERMKPRGIILSGSPASVPDDGSPRAPQKLFDAGVPILGICYGQQVMSHQLGGEVRPGHETGEGGEFGRAFLTVTEPCVLFDGLWDVGERHQVWMSHGDKVTRFAPGFRIVATSDGAPLRGDRRRRAPLLRHTVPSRSRPHARWREADRQFRAPCLRLRGRLVDGGVPRDQDRGNSRAGGQRARDLRPVGRGRLGGGGGADPRGDRRPAHLRLRRSWADADERGRTGGDAVPRALQHQRSSTSTRPRCSWGGSRA
jgi:GMP synthase (glutamine-hydrolysing) A subunit